MLHDHTLPCTVSQREAARLQAAASITLHPVGKRFKVFVSGEQLPVISELLRSMREQAPRPGTRPAPHLQSAAHPA